jgi:hypothetical protein
VSFRPLRGMWNPAAPLRLTRKQQSDVEALVGQRKTPQRVAVRAMIVLASAEGKAVNAIAHALSVARPMVYLWRRRFEKAGV